MPEGEQQDGFDYKLTVDLKGIESIILRTPKVIKKPVRRTTRKKTKTKLIVVCCRYSL